MTLEEIQQQHRAFLEQAQEQYRQTIQNATAMMQQQIAEAQTAIISARAKEAPVKMPPTVEWVDGKLLLNETAANTLMELFGAVQQGLQEVAELLKQQSQRKR